MSFLNNFWNVSLPYIAISVSVVFIIISIISVIGMVKVAIELDETKVRYLGLTRTLFRVFIGLLILFIVIEILNLIEPYVFHFPFWLSITLPLIPFVFLFLFLFGMLSRGTFKADKFYAFVMGTLFSAASISMVIGAGKIAVIKTVPIVKTIFKSKAILREAEEGIIAESKIANKSRFFLDDGEQINKEVNPELINLTENNKVWLKQETIAGEIIWQNPTQKGHFGEYFTYTIMGRDTRYISLKLKIGEQGIDHVYIKYDNQTKKITEILIIETKTDKAQLAKAFPKQMSDEWIKNNLNKIIGKGDNKSKEIAKIILDKIDNEPDIIKKMVFRHNLETGTTTKIFVNKAGDEINGTEQVVNEYYAMKARLESFSKNKNIIQ